MAKKGGSRHLNRIAAPAFSLHERKTSVWLAKPMPGRHSTKSSISLRALVRDALGLAVDAREAENIIKSGKIFVDGTAVTDSKAAIGLMDVIAIPEIKKYYLVLLDHKSRLKLQEIEKGKAGSKLCKILGKHTVRGNKPVLTLHDGRNLVADNSYKVGDSLKLKIPAASIEATLRLEPGARCLIIHGKHAGKMAKLKQLTEGTAALQPLATLEADGSEIITLTDYLFVIGDEI